MRQTPIEVVEKVNEVVECPKFNKSVSVYKCVGEKNKHGCIEINGKCNSVNMESCECIELKLDSVMSTVEVSNCKNVRITVKSGANVLSIVIDNTDGCHIHLNQESGANPDFQVVAAKSSEMTVTYEHEGEMVEKPLPEQFVYHISREGDKPKIQAEVSDLYSN